MFLKERSSNTRLFYIILEDSKFYDNYYDYRICESYNSEPIITDLNSILLQVKVPVLSLNMYSIWPNYSLIVEVKTVHPTPLDELYISSS